MVKNNVVQSTNKADTATQWPTVSAVKTYGSNSDTWGTTWTPSDINNSNFGVALAVHNNSLFQRTAYVDYISISVYYTDVTAPVISSMSDVYAEATSSAGAIVNYTEPTATDNVDLSVLVVCLPPTGSLFALGSTPVTCNATDTAGNIATPVNFNVVVQDTTAPVINLNGTTPMDIEYGSVYTESGATWTDDVDGSGAAVVGGDAVNTSALGSYVVTYNYTDTNGNTATQVSRTVNVVDTTKPIIALTGDAVMTLEYGDTYTEPGATWTDDVDGSGAAVVGGDTVDTLTLGTYTVTYNYTDSSSNVADEVTRTVNVVPRAITVTADPQTKVYGEADPTLTYQITSGTLVGSDTFSGELNRVAGENVGLYAIGQNTLALSSNYSLTYAGDNLEITKAPLAVLVDDSTKVYGQVNPGVNVYIIGMVIGDDVNVTLYTTADTLSPVGDYPVTAVLDGTDLGNYQDPVIVDGTMTITKALLTITADAKNKFYGASDPALTYQITSGALVGTDSFTGSLARPAGEAVGTYLINRGTLTLNDNYELTFVGALLTIKAPVLATNTTDNTIPDNTGSQDTDTTKPDEDENQNQNQNETDDTEVLGTQTNGDDKKSDSSSNWLMQTLLGIYYWIWLLALALGLGGWWFLIAKRRKDEDK